jgi:hypothetical protein
VFVMGVAPLRLRLWHRRLWVRLLLLRRWRCVLL